MGGGASRSALASCQEGGKQWKMASREPGNSVSPLPWAAALLLVLCMERALALPEVQKNTEESCWSSARSRSRPLLSVPLARQKLRFCP